MTLDPALLHDDASIPPAGWHKRLFAWFMHTFSPKADHRLHDRKEKLFAALSKANGVADVAEIGMGTAPNLKYYAARVDSIVGVDFNPAMQPYALESAARAGVPPDKLALVVGRAEALPLPDGCVDAVVATHLMCSVSDVALTLSEVLRVLRPGGVYVFLEHVAAHPDRVTLRTLQSRLTPVSTSLADGCHLNRDTLQHIRDARFSRVEGEAFDVPVPCVCAVLAPHVAGVATK